MEAELEKRLEMRMKEVEKSLMRQDQTTVVAEAVRPSTTQRAKRRTWGCVLLVVILMIVATVTVVIVKMKQNDKKAPLEDTSPSIVVCSGATPIEKGQTNISSWITNATSADELAFFSSCMSSSSFLIAPYVFLPKAWFSLIGTGDVYAVSMWSSDLDFYSAISVGVGSMCNNLVCVAYTTDFLHDEYNESSNRSAAVLFQTEVGTPYYIGVEGFRDPTIGLVHYYPSHGNFTLSIAVVENVPVNRDCSNATVIQPGESLVPGTITNATGNMHFNYPCEQSAGVSNVWYSIVGTGDVFDISTCTSDLDFDSGLSVSTGSCENLECLASSQNEMFSPSPYYDCTEAPYAAGRVIFRTVAGVEYFLQVFPKSIFGTSMNGEFTLNISIGQGPANDACSNATRVEVGSSSVLGSMSLASWDTNMNTSCSVTSYMPIVWYSFIGTGDVYVISTCSSVLNFDSAVSILTGTCDNLECVIPGWSFQQDCPESSFLASKILLRTEIGELYFIAVEATNYTEGSNFDLNVSRVEPLANDECSGALDIQANETVYGTTKDAAISLLYYTQNLWYHMVGNGTKTEASLCGGATKYDSYIAIYEGDIDSCDQKLIAENDDFCEFASRVEWFAELGVNYFIRVTGNSTGDTGEFGLTLQYT